MKKKILLTILILAVLFVLFQLCSIHLYKGNLYFFIHDEHWVDTIHIEIFIDGNKVIEEHYTGIWKGFSFNTKLKRHKVVIKINGHESQELHINTVLFTHIQVFYYDDSNIMENSFYDDVDERFKFVIKKRPVFLILS